MNLNPYRNGTQNYIICSLILKGWTREDIFRELYPKVARQIPPFVFKSNVKGGPREPLAIYDQIPRLFQRIGFLITQLLPVDMPEALELAHVESSIERANYANKRWRAAFYQRVVDEYNNANASSVPAVTSVEIETEEIEEIEEEIEEILESEPQVRTLRDKIAWLENRLDELQAFCKMKEANGMPFDQVSTVAYVHGGHAVMAGIEPEDFVVGIGLTWNDDTRSEAGLDYSVDYSRYIIEGTPLQFGFMVRLVKAGIPVYLCGPTQSGKSTMAGLLADYLELEYGELNCSNGISRTEVYGNGSGGGFIEKEMPIRFKTGGVFVFEEIDGADPNMLLAVNNAISSKRMFNPMNGERMIKHQDFIPIATGNTWGKGATAKYRGRDGLDDSTIERFKYGRIFVDYNRDLQHDLIWRALEAAEVEIEA